MSIADIIESNMAKHKEKAIVIDLVLSVLYLKTLKLWAFQINF